MAKKPDDFSDLIGAGPGDAAAPASCGAQDHIETAASPTLDTESINSAGQSSRLIVAHAFEELGGVDALVKWGKKQPEKFYSLWARLCTPRTDPRTGAAPRGRYKDTGGNQQTVQVTDFTDGG